MVVAICNDAMLCCAPPGVLPSMPSLASCCLLLLLWSCRRSSAPGPAHHHSSASRLLPRRASRVQGSLHITWQSTAPEKHGQALLQLPCPPFNLQFCITCLTALSSFLLWSSYPPSIHSSSTSSYFLPSLAQLGKDKLSPPSSPCQ